MKRSAPVPTSVASRGAFRSRGTEAIAIECRRQYLARYGRRQELLRLYAPDLPSIPNGNTAGFWDERMERKPRLQDQDGLTQSRVRSAASFVRSDAKKVFDLGVGYGFIEDLLSTRANPPHLAGIDIAPESIRDLKQRFPQGMFLVHDLGTYRWKKEAFDTVFALEVLEHVSPEEIFPLLQHIYDTLIPGGRFIVSVPLNEGLPQLLARGENPNQHTRMYTPLLLKTELELAGFREVRHEYFYAFASQYTLKNFIARTLLPSRWKFNSVVMAVEKPTK